MENAVLELRHQNMKQRVTDVPVTLCLRSLRTPEDGCPYKKSAVYVIFSCLTLWSMMWREASSLWMSSTVMPICTISTMA